ncbi:MAG: hypothetical protein RBR67_16160 [Desulfobacterium sp.]|nr:hypothetical protein [Desulfobacterium sp.]
MMTEIQHRKIRITLPMPIFLIIEDVGWWQGFDGSSYQEPYRNNLGRPHCLEDYQALAHLAQRLSMRIAIGMAMCEWDRTDFLKNIPGATWMGSAWNNQKNRRYDLDRAADYLNAHDHLLEIALHGVGHEFWNNGQMERSEFHDKNCNMRPENIIVSHLEAFAGLLDQNHILARPRLFIPPALNHSFGDHSIQPLLKKFGIDYVTTRFSRSRQFKAPRHPKLTWESGVTLLERGNAPVAWDVSASPPVWNNSPPILPLHWANLLHVKPERNLEIINPWADMLLVKTSGPNFILAKDAAACWRQAAVCYLAEIKNENSHIIINLGALPRFSSLQGPFIIRIQNLGDRGLRCEGAKIVEQKKMSKNLFTLELLPEQEEKKLSLLR